MEFDLSFLLGVLGGGVTVAILAVIFFASYRAAKAKEKEKDRGSANTILIPRDSGPPGQPHARQPAPSAPVPVSAPTIRVTPNVSRAADAPSSGHTKILDAMDDRENMLTKNIQEVRDILLTLATAVGATQNASGEAATTFKSAREAMAKVDFSISAELADAHGVLVREIDRVVRSNTTLHTELDKANRGIIEQRKQIEELRVQARIDALTRIPNRAAFDERLAEYLGLLERTNLVFTLMLLDLDFFKKINDTHGHVNGDRILRGVAEKIADAVRANDFAARYGGEEFAVIFPGTAQAEALVVAERMRQDIAKTNFRLDGANVKITVSGGIAESRKGMDADRITATADAALYRAKENGRNQILAADGADSRDVERL